MANVICVVIIVMVDVVLEPSIIPDSVWGNRYTGWSSKTVISGLTLKRSGHR